MRHCGGDAATRVFIRLFAGLLCVTRASLVQRPGDLPLSDDACAASGEAGEDCALQLLSLRQWERAASKIQADRKAELSATAAASEELQEELQSALQLSKSIAHTLEADQARRLPHYSEHAHPINGFYVLLAVMLILGLLLRAAYSSPTGAESAEALFAHSTSPPDRMQSTSALPSERPVPPKLEKAGSAPPVMDRLRLSAAFDQVTRLQSRSFLNIEKQPSTLLVSQTPDELEKLTFRETAMNIFSLYVGAGILQLPFAFSIAGWVCGGIIGFCTIIMLFPAMLITECIRAAEAQNRGVDDRQMDFADLGRYAFGSWGETAIGVTFSLELWLYGAYFVVLAARNISPVAGFMPDTLLVVATGIVCLGMMFIPPRHLAALNSSLGVSTLFVAVGAMIVGGLALPVALPASQRLVVGSVPGMLKGFGIAAVGFAGHPCIPSIYASCGEKKRFNEALFLGISLASLFYVFVGALGYYIYGPSIKDVFTLNLGLGLDMQALPSLGWLSPLVAGAIAVKLIITYPFVVEPVCYVLYKPADGKEESINRFQQTFARVGVCLALVLISVFFEDKVDIFADLLGCVATMATSVFFPCFSFLQLCDASAGKRAVTCGVIACGAVLMVVGTKVAVGDLLNPEHHHAE